MLIHLLQAHRNAAAQAQAVRTEVTPKESLAVVQCLLHVVRTHGLACCTYNASLNSFHTWLVVCSPSFRWPF